MWRQMNGSHKWDIGGFFHAVGPVLGQRRRRWPNTGQTAVRDAMRKNGINESFD